MQRLTDGREFEVLTFCQRTEQKCKGCGDCGQDFVLKKFARQLVNEFDITEQDAVALLREERR